MGFSVLKSLPVICYCTLPTPLFHAIVNCSRPECLSLWFCSETWWYLQQYCIPVCVYGRLWSSPAQHGVVRWQPELSYNAALSRGWVLGAVEQLMLLILPVLLKGLVLGGWSRVWGLLFCVWESYLSFLIIDTCVRNMASGVSKVAAASGWEVCGAIPLFLTFACGVLHTKSMLESWRTWLDVVILPYSAASQRPFELDVLRWLKLFLRFTYCLLLSLFFHPGVVESSVPVICHLCNCFLCSSEVST